MVKRCVAAGCSNTYKSGVSLFLFPKDAQLRKKWTDQVKRTRDKWEGPSDYSVLCSAHFEEDCFEPEAKVAHSLGLVEKRKQRLKADAVPTLFERPVSQQRTTAQPVAGPSQPARKKRRVAYEKRERARVSTPIQDGLMLRIKANYSVHSCWKNLWLMWTVAITNLKIPSRKILMISNTLKVTTVRCVCVKRKIKCLLYVACMLNCSHPWLMKRFKLAQQLK